jgi:hypothetical protein
METELFMEILLRDIGAERSILVDRQNDKEAAREERERGRQTDRQRERER